jgi:hypothetical protein
MLDILLALNCITRSRKHLEVNKLMDMVSLCVTVHEPVSMFVDAANEITGHADVNRATGSTCEDIQIVLPHTLSFT